MTWHLIATRPADTWILVAHGRIEPRVHVVEWSSRAECWYESAGLIDGDFEPTHWMPLPEPPQ